MQLHFNSISEPTLPGPKWQKLFNLYWAAYKAWLDTKGQAYLPDLKTSQAALKEYMPEMVPTYERLCELANADAVAERFLTGFQPPAYISACSQAVITGGKIQLIRNYDYHPHLMEGTLLLSAWNGKKVIANSDCLSGVLDGMNEDGLVISLTFGGRKAVGKGFGIPFILRYVLEFCSNVKEAVETLSRIPSHMSYNVTVIDRSGAFKTVRLAPDRAPVITDAAFTTNHQGTVDWPENATFNKTLKRYAFLDNILLEKDLTPDALAKAFLAPPLYNTQFTEGFGTLYTAVYQPREGRVQIRWPNENMLQSFDDFKEEYKLIKFKQTSAEPAPSTNLEQVPAEAVQSPVQVQKTKGKSLLEQNWQEVVADTIVKTMSQTSSSTGKEQENIIPEKIIQRGEVSWEILADFWSRKGMEYWKKWKQ